MKKPKPLGTKHFHRASDVRLIRGGKEFFNNLESLIRASGSEIHIQFYILEDDETGLKIIKALIDASKSGVEVHLVLDSYGSAGLDRKYIDQMTEAGIQFKWFKPVLTLSNMELGRRMHHKIAAFDERIAIAAGLNIADRYNDIDNIPAWLDFALVVEGPSAIEIKKRCLQIWEKKSALGKRLKKFRLPISRGDISTESALVKVSVNDWLRGKADIFEGYRRAINSSEEEIVIAGGYFLPGRFLRRSLSNARKRKVRISVILTRFSDVAMAKQASEYLYRWMLKEGIRIFEWKPNVMHGKAAVVDRSWSTVGSFNLNYLSSFESIELNIEVVDNKFSSALSNMLLGIAEKECIEVIEKDFLRQYTILRRVENWMSYVFVRYAFRFLNLFSKKPKIK